MLLKYKEKLGFGKNGQLTTAGQSDASEIPFKFDLNSSE